MTSINTTTSSHPSTVIVVDHLSKRYPRSEHRPSLRHEAASLLKRAISFQSTPTGQTQPFFALNDISFSVQRGETVGIVGRNGSGKTTLLRLLSGITRPTMGHISITGRFATLIGLGAGFNPERTGRENIFLNSAIQGVLPRQVRSIVDDIIAFAELEQFIDTPVKLYSSGMSARLAFSIAIHILPEIIFLDEVLAVGDAAFQEKCMERIFRLKEEGRTILFVSHASSMVQKLCERSIWLHNGHLMMDGPSKEVLHQYEEATLKSG